jgi:hypothetical protein
MGKTHLLKLMASILKAGKENNGHGKEKLEAILGEKLVGYFKPEQLGRLVSRAQGRKRAEIELIADNANIAFNFATNAKSVKIDNFSSFSETNSLYLPPREIISVFEGFISLYQNREIAFDETYYQLALALDLPILKGRRFEEVQNLIQPLEEITKSKVVKENGRFYFQNAQGKMEMPLVAEGYRKLATLMYLMANGEIAQNSVLFWDEPEANMNPKLTKIVAELLCMLAKKGVQIFLASHDYLLTNLLSLQSEYAAQSIEILPIRFFGLYEKDNVLVFDEGTTLSDLTENPIVKEFTALYDLEQQFFNKALQS